MTCVRLVVCVLVTCVSVVMSCPPGCQCMRSGGVHTTVCEKTNLLEIPDGVPLNTDQLHLRENRIRLLPRGAFSRLTSLSTLSLTHCGLEVIEPNAFTGLTNLAYLSLEYNHIVELQSNAFSGLFALKRLFLNNNMLVTVDNYAFHGLNLTHLRLDNNTDLADISARAFQGASIYELNLGDSSLRDSSLDSLRPLAESLKVLRWQSNRQALRIPADLFRGFQFKSLNLDNCGISDASFLEFVAATALSLEGNPTGPIDFSHYPRLQQVRSLHLSRTGFNRVDGKYFKDMANLDELYLNQNGIMSLPSTLEPVFSRLVRLGIEKNNIYCNCELVWFKRWLQATRTFVGGATCHHPFLEDILFMQESDMTCSPPTITSSSKSMNVSTGSNVVIQCVAKGDPPPKVTWHWPNGENTVIAPPLNINESKTVGSLRIAPVRSTDQGLYRCEATNVAGNVSASTEIRVYRVAYDPQIGGRSRGSSQLGAIRLVYSVIITFFAALLV